MLSGLVSLTPRCGGTSPFVLSAHGSAKGSIAAGPLIGTVGRVVVESWLPSLCADLLYVSGFSKLLVFSRIRDPQVIGFPSVDVQKHLPTEAPARCPWSMAVLAPASEGSQQHR